MKQASRRKFHISRFKKEQKQRNKQSSTLTTIHKSFSTQSLQSTNYILSQVVIRLQSLPQDLGYGIGRTKCGLWRAKQGQTKARNLITDRMLR